MKLTDLGLTPTAIAATKKLGKQVSYSSVAAGKAPRQELGLLGISIAQKQVKGFTSSVNEELSAKSAFQLLSDLADDMGWNMRLDSEDYDTEEAMQEALKMFHFWKANKANGSEMQHSYSVIANQLRSLGSIEVIAKQNEVFKKIGFQAQPWVQSQIDKISDIYANADKVYHHFQAAERILSMLELIVQMKPEHKSYVFAQATLKKLGLK